MGLWAKSGMRASGRGCDLTLSLPDNVCPPENETSLYIFPESSYAFCQFGKKFFPCNRIHRRPFTMNSAKSNRKAAAAAPFAFTAAVLSALLLAPAPARADFSFASFTASQGTHTNKIRLNWSLTPGSTPVTAYNVAKDSYWFDHQTGGLTYIAQLDGTELQHDDTNVVPGIPYGYILSAYDDRNNARTEKVYGWAGTPAEAVDVSATQGTYADKVRITWDVPDGAQGSPSYTVRRLDRSVWIYLGMSTTNRYFVDTNVVAGVRYTYRVDTYGDLFRSDTVEGWVDPGTPVPTVTDLAATQGTLTDRVRLTWSAPNGAASYSVVRLRDYGGVVGFETLADSLTTPGYEDTATVPGVHYTYRVDVIDEWGRTSHSALVEGWTLTEIPVVTDLEATQGTLTDRVRLTWTAPDYAASYKVRRYRYQGYTDLVQGLTSPGYDDTAAEPGEEYRYQIFVTDEWGRTSQSDFATGWVGLRADNDDFEDAAVLSGKSGSASSSNTNATHQVGEPFLHDIGAWDFRTNTLWWAWTAPMDGVVQFNTEGSVPGWDPDDEFDSVMAVYTGSSLSSLTEVAFNDDINSASNVASSNQFAVVAGTTYRIQVAGKYSGDVGAIRLNWSYTHFLVTLDPNGGTISTNAVLVPAGQKLGTALQSFPVPVRNGYRFVDWKFENNASVSASSMFAITESHALHAEWSWISQNDDFEDALPLDSPGQASGFSEMSNTNATLQAGEPLPSTYPNATHTLWWSWTAPANGTAHFSTTNSVDTFGSQIDTVIGVYTGSALGSLVEVATGDDGVKESGFIDDIGTRWSVVDFEATEGTTYYVCVGVNDKYNQQVVEGMIRVYWSLETSGVSSGGFALLPPGSSHSDIPLALGEVADPALADVIGNVDDYNDFAEWANGKGANGVRASRHAAASYLLGTTALLQNAPVITIDSMVVTNGIPLPRRRGSSSDVVSLTLTVTVTDGGEPVEVTAAKVAALFEATTDLSDWDTPAKKLDPHAEAITSGSDTTVTIRVTPGDGSAPQAFLRISR